MTSLRCMGACPARVSVSVLPLVVMGPGLYLFLFYFILLLHSLRFSLLHPASLFYAIYLPWSLDFVIILFLLFYQCFILLFYQCFKFYFNCFRVYPCRGPRWAETLDVSIVCVLNTCPEWRSRLVKHKLFLRHTLTTH